MKGRRAVGLALVLAAAADCGSGPTGPTSGTLRVAVASASASDRALLIEIAGADSSVAIDTVTAMPGSAYTVFATRVVRSRWRVIVTGPVVNGTLVEIHVPDVSQAGRYSGTVIDVADTGFAELPPGSRALTVSR